jgi:hypothetical protein
MASNFMRSTIAENECTAYNTVTSHLRQIGGHIPLIMSTSTSLKVTGFKVTPRISEDEVKDIAMGLSSVRRSYKKIAISNYKVLYQGCH